jgi:acetyl esterase/lipase
LGRGNAQRLGGDPNRLAVAGCSAGGGLSAIVSTIAAMRGPRLRLAILHCPWLDLTLSQPSIARYASGYDLDREFLDWFVAAYIGNSGKAGDPLASPLLHSIPASMPAMVILAAECDPLFDEARLYADRLHAARVPTTFVEAPGMVHAFKRDHASDTGRRAASRSRPHGPFAAPSALHDPPAGACHRLRAPVVAVLGLRHFRREARARLSATCPFAPGAAGVQRAGDRGPGRHRAAAAARAPDRHCLAVRPAFSNSAWVMASARSDSI